MMTSSWSRVTTIVLLLCSGLIPAGTGSAAEMTLPSGFPADVPIADYMTVKGITDVKGNFMVDLHARDRSLAEVVEWFKTELGAEGWALKDELVTTTKAILPFTKNDRKCGISVTNFVLDESFQRDDSTRGITIQTAATGGSGQPDRGAGSSSSSTAEDAQN